VFVNMWVGLWIMLVSFKIVFCLCVCEYVGGFVDYVSEF